MAIRFYPLGFDIGEPRGIVFILKILTSKLKLLKSRITQHKIYNHHIGEIS
jgi:hypothetical protein